MDIVWFDSGDPFRNRMLGDWCASVIGMPLREPYSTMGVVDGNDLIAVVVFHDWKRRAGVVDLSIGAISPRWMTRGTMAAMADYIFGYLGCQMAVMRISDRNTRALRVSSALGWNSVHVPRMRGVDEGEYIMTLTVEEWRSSKFNRKG